MNFPYREIKLVIVSEDHGSSGLFVSVRVHHVKDPKLTKITKTIPQNARYTSPQIQNKVIELMSNIVTEKKCDKLGIAGTQ